MSHIIVETRDRVQRIEIARADKKNALTQDMYRAMREALAAADADAQVRAILIHGARDCFTAGNDLKDFLERKPGDGPAESFRFISALPTVAKPLIAAVGGPAVGVGTTMLLHCDLVYASPAARFQMPFVPLGVVPEASSSLLLPMIAGYQRAAELLMLGQPFAAEKALAAGFVTEIVPEDRLLEHAAASAKAVAALPPASVRHTKALMKRPLLAAIKAQMEEEGRIFAERLQSGEAKEAMTAFFEKRKPDFSRF
ncbi:MAG TPA: enoyl-CoA hydratase [Burkholderiales bacterium]|nr:enoyl-CoA hydratase [Burkholderiales bacterium]